MEDNKKITIYAPIDCDIFPIEQIEDETIASKALGDGLFILPKGDSNKFYSVFDNAKIALIADTKHAFFIKHENGPLCLMHIGLETVSMQGKPFDVKVKLDDKVNLKKEIVEVDLDLIRSKKISLSTPLLFDETQCRGFKFEVIKGLKTAKRGEPIGYLVVAKEKEKEEAKQDFENHKNKFYDAASRIYGLVGEINNFKSYANCMTRFRLIINNKSEVKVDEIKKISIVKGINWNGNELQIIIGGDVIKVRDQFQKFLENNSIADPNTGAAGASNSKTFPVAKKGFREKVLVPIVSCVTPLLPILLASGLFKGLYSILSATMPHVFPSTFNSVDLANNNALLGPFLLYILGDIGITFMGFGLFISICKYLKEDMVSASIMGLIMFAPALYGVFLAKTGGPDKTEWILWNGFKIGEQDINYAIEPYTNSLFVSAAGAILFHVANKWVKSWIPGLVDIIFRMALVVLITTVGVFFIIGPVISFIQAILSVIIRAIGNLPYGIGVGIFSMMWQPLVLTGAHVPISLIIQNDFNQNGSIVFASALYFGTVIGTFGQFGAGLGVTCVTKDTSVRRAGIGGIIPAFLGITEPIIYGINLVRVKPFIWGAFASLFGGIFSGLMGVGYYSISGLGVLSFPSLVVTNVTNISQSPINEFTQAINNTTMNLLWGIIACVIAAGLGALFVILFAKERPNELKETKKINNLVLKLYSLKSYYFASSDESEKSVSAKLNNLSNENLNFILGLYIKWLFFKFNLIYLVNNLKNRRKQMFSIDKNLTDIKDNLNSVALLLDKDFQANVKKYEKEVIKCNTIKTKLSILNDKLDFDKDSLQVKIDKLNSKKKVNQAKLDKLNSSAEIKINKLNEQISNLENKKDEICKNYKMLKENIQNIISQYLDKSKDILTNLSDKVNDKNFLKIENKYFNAINSVDICYGLADKQTFDYSKKEILNLK